VFQAYFTTFLIEPGYEEPIRTIEEMLRSEKKFGFIEHQESLFINSFDPVDSAILKDAGRCPDEPTCFIWAAVYHNISTVMNDLDIQSYRAKGGWTDENNRPLLCEIEGRFFGTSEFVMVGVEGDPILEVIDVVLGQMVEGGIFIHLKKKSFDKLKIQSKLDVPTFDTTYSPMNIIHLQTPFYFLVLGYVLAVVCFATEIMWHRYSSKGREPTGTFVCHGQT
jgi:hypothetical protein